mmetsp:Transcript_42211/g.89771  ORF Transcript_42211/g.89771 Transcript_42211/m.89771 type:complete len:102 (-) Transcript_42211:67-372(-)
MVVYFPAVAPPDARAAFGVRITAAAAVVAAALARKLLLSSGDEDDVATSSSAFLADGRADAAAVRLAVDDGGCVEKAWVPAMAAKSRDRVLSFTMAALIIM